MVIFNWSVLHILFGDVFDGLFRHATQKLISIVLALNYLVILRFGNFLHKLRILHIFQSKVSLLISCKLLAIGACKFNAFLQDQIFKNILVNLLNRVFFLNQGLEFVIQIWIFMNLIHRLYFILDVLIFLKTDLVKFITFNFIPLVFR